ncbi:T9SS type A sorting domain-containing protein [candidate division KSB1 bacterium]|nr:T9SS type A sorting domain-containing protein [candidate division KSB1 bacterium]
MRIKNILVKLVCTSFWIATWASNATDHEKWLVLQTGSTGLPGGSIRSLLIDNECFLWVGGGGSPEEAGIALYDGNSLLNITHLYGIFPRGYGVNTIARDSTGNLWLNNQTGYPENGAISRFDGEKWTHFFPKGLLKIVTDRDGTIYAGSWYGLYRFDGSDWYIVPIPGFNDIYVIDIEFDIQHDMWLLTDVGFILKRQDTYESIPPPINFEDVQSFVIDFKNDKWIINRTRDEHYHFHYQLVHYNGQSWNILSAENSLLPDAIFETLTIDSTNTVWLGTSEGAYIVDPQVQEPQLVEPLQSHHITTITVDSRDRKWIGTSEGDLLMVNDSDILTLASDEIGLQSNYVNKIVKDRQGKMWIACESGGLAFAEGTKISTWPADNLIQEYHRCAVTALAVDSINTVWAGIGGDGLLKIEQGENELLTTLNSALPDNNIADIFVDSQNRKWIATKKGVALYDQQTWTTIDSNNSELRGAKISAITVDRAGIAWIASEIGLNKYDGEQWTCYTPDNSPLPDAWIHALAVDEKNHLWIGTHNNLAVLDSEEWTIYTMDNSILSSPRIGGFDFSKSGMKWIINLPYWYYGHDTGGGIFRIEDDQWQELSYIEMANPTDVEYDDDGNLWVATCPHTYDIQLESVGGGVLIYNENGIERPTFPSHKGNICPLRLKAEPDTTDTDEPGTSDPDTTETDEPDSSVLRYSIAPNPAYKMTTITYKLDTLATACIEIYDILGQKLYQSTAELQPAGTYQTVWRGVNNSGQAVSSGVYICQIRIQNDLFRRKFTLLR